ncbi:MAG TPA: hypothetical protein DCW90_03700 [Lachnospiraceae bacterium]|nr:hypothetical protein [Lachnospiraceae bacterium]
MKSEIEQYIKYYNEQRITRMDESCAIQAYPLDYIKNSVAAIKTATLKSLTFWGHLNQHDCSSIIPKFY